MSGGTMRMRLSLPVALALLAGPVAAEPADCPTLAAVLEGATGLGLTAAPAAQQGDWCVLDGARSSGDGKLRITVGTLRLRGETVGDALQAVELKAEGLRVTPALGDRDLPDWLRDLLRLQTADVELALRRDAEADQLLVERGHLGLSGGAALDVTATVAGGDLTAASLLAGRVTGLAVAWKNDGRTLRPVLEALGEQLEPGATDTKAVLAARSALARLVDAVPEGKLSDETAAAFTDFIAALPQGRGKLTVEARSEGGIGMAQIGVLALSGDPAGPEALARLLSDVTVEAVWAPGIAP